MNAMTQMPDEKRGVEWGTRVGIGAAGALRIHAAVVTLNSELNEASSFSIRVDGVTGEEDRVLTLGWL